MTTTMVQPKVALDGKVVDNTFPPLLSGRSFLKTGLPTLLICLYATCAVLDRTQVLPLASYWPFELPSDLCETDKELQLEELLPKTLPTLEEMAAEMTPAYGYIPPAGRSLASSSASGSGSGSSHGAHQHDALIYLFCAIVIGTVLMHIACLPMFASMQQTVVLFALGTVTAAVMHPHGGNLSQHIGKFGVSFDMWMLIDPHMLLFALLPALLTGDAMTIDTAVARRVAKQCLYLAGPGVAICAFATAGFLKLYLPASYDWNFKLCLTLGSIFAATDPVAVVGLLKELGASPTLTVQIQGESLLNDGTAIVLYTVAYEMFKGKYYDFELVLEFLVKVAVCAMLLGFAIGWAFAFWIRLASNRFSHASGLIQISLTLCCAYVSFILSEGVLKISGVLATVSSALVLADNMWPDIVSKESMEHVWHMLEYLGNTVIFFLAGSLFGNCMMDIGWEDYCHLFVIYLSQLVFRGSLMFASRPLLKHLSADKTPVSVAEAAVMTWGGLRGAVGLALAIVVYQERGGGHLDQRNSQRVFFYTGGLAALTLVINATTCPLLVKKLGITKTPEARRRLLLGLCSHMFELVEKKDAEGNAPPRHVREVIGKLLDEIVLHVEHEAGHGHGHGDAHGGDDGQSGSAGTKQRLSQRAEPVEGFQERKHKIGAQILKSKSAGVGNFKDLQTDKQLEAAEKSLKMYESEVEVLMQFPNDPLAKMQEPLKEKMNENAAELAMMRSVNEVFLSLVQAAYWELINSGIDLSDEEAQILLRSISTAEHDCEEELLDLGVITKALNINTDLEHRLENVSMNPRKSDQSSFSTATVISFLKMESAEGKTGLARILDSSLWKTFITTVIAANCLLTLAEADEDGTTEEKDVGWFIAEFVAVVIFTFEFMLMFAVLRCEYFRNKYNLLDFFLVVVGLVGIVVELLAKNADFVEIVGVFKANKIFRVLRLLRLTRLIAFFWSIKASLEGKQVIQELAAHITNITMLFAFVKAHTVAQQHFLTFFSSDGKVDLPEEARCLLNSKACVLQAKALAAHESQAVDHRVLRGMKALKDTVKVAEHLEKYVSDAHEAGIINNREAESFLHPLQDHEKKVKMMLDDETHGVRRKTVENIGIEVAQDVEDEIEASKRIQKLEQVEEKADHLQKEKIQHEHEKSASGEAADPDGNGVVAETGSAPQNGIAKEQYVDIHCPFPSSEKKDSQATNEDGDVEALKALVKERDTEVKQLKSKLDALRQPKGDDAWEEQVNSARVMEDNKGGCDPCSPMTCIV